MFEELFALLEPHVIDFILACFAISIDKSIWIELTSADFLRQMAFRGKMSNQFKKSALEFLLMIQYNYRCISRNYKVIQHFRTFRYGRDFPTGAVFGDFEPLKVDFNTSNTLKAHLYAKLRQNPLRVVVCWRVDETRSRKKYFFF